MTYTTSKFDISTLRLGHEVYSPNYGGDLVVATLGFGHVRYQDVIDGLAKPVAASLSADGRGFDSETWHKGPEAEAVYVERHDARGCFFHGWVDSASRRLVQAG
jgi:hypothetical protein